MQYPPFKFKVELNVFLGINIALVWQEIERRASLGDQVRSSSSGVETSSGMIKETAYRKSMAAAEDS